MMSVKHILAKSLGFYRVRSAVILASALLVGFGALTPVAVYAASGAHLRISYNEMGRTQFVQVGVNKSVIVDLPVDAGEVIVSQPGVANAIMRSKTRAVIQGIAAGETNIFFLDSRGSSIAVVEISVAQDSTGLANTLNRLIPGARISVESFADAVVLSGDAPAADDVIRAMQVAGQFVGDPTKVTSLIAVAGGQQIALKVTVAEVKRTVAKELGINLTANLQVGSLNYGVSGVEPLMPSSGYDVGLNLGQLAIDASLRALEARNAVRMLAEPVLTAMSGQEADFHVGGEFPVVTMVDGTQTTIYKPYGIQLKFTPTVKSNGMVGLAVNTEVSEPQQDNTLNTRRATTTVELRAGQTLAIAGLLDERMRRQLSSLPGLGNIPILGALFRSHEYTSEQTELVILVTPIISKPMNVQPPLPTDSYRPTGDAEAIFLGRMESLYGARSGVGNNGFRGSVGFVID